MRSPICARQILSNHFRHMNIPADWKPMNSTWQLLINFTKSCTYSNLKQILVRVNCQRKRTLELERNRWKCVVNTAIIQPKKKTNESEENLCNS